MTKNYNTNRIFTTCFNNPNIYSFSSICSSSLNHHSIEAGFDRVVVFLPPDTASHYINQPVDAVQEKMR